MHAVNSNVYISGNIIFSGNSAGRDGGGMSAWDDSNIDISGNTIFSGNSAASHGGGVSALFSACEHQWEHHFQWQLC